MHKIVFGSNFSFPFFKSIASMVLLAVLLIKWNSIARECDESKESLRDFNQYYAGALAVVNGQSSSLYPEPIPNAQRNAGIDAIPKKTFVELCIEYGVPVGHFIQPPIAA